MALRTPHAPSRRRAGFTILELTIVLAVMAILSSFTIPAWFDRPEVTLDNAARLLARDMREVQNRAALYQATLLLHFDEDGGGYSATTEEGTALVSPYGAHPFVRRYGRDAVFRGVKIASWDLGGLEAVEFTDRGTARQGARVVLTYRGEQRILRMRPFSGLIELDGMAKPWVDGGE
jgi:prepilin-type N-terminal cleavage/methylation domain-containing protein